MQKTKPWHNRSMNEAEALALAKSLERRTGRKAKLHGKSHSEISAPLEKKSNKRKKTSKKANAASTPNLHTNMRVRVAKERKEGTSASEAELKSTLIQMPSKPTTHKFGAVATISDNIKFSSKLEARRYEELKALQASGVILGFLRQVPFHLGSETVYRLDFQVFWADGRVSFEDVKGRETESFRAKMCLIADIYPWAEIHLLERA